MQILTVTISSGFIEKGLGLGYTFRSCRVTSGLPSDAVLFNAGLDDKGDLDLMFKSQSSSGDGESLVIALESIDEWEDK